jgi:membrane protease YdiL (CAAX protease family)
MEGFPINTPTLYLDCIILAAVAYPSGVSNSLFVTWKGAPREVSTGWLAVLVLPYAAVVPAVWALSPKLFAASLLIPSMLALHSTRGLLLLGASVLLAPVVLVIEYGILGFASYRVIGKFPRGIAVQRFWRKGLSPTGHLLLVLVAAGEEIFYRLIGLGVFVSISLPLPFALVISSVAYGLNHLFLGKTVVISKSVAGLVYGTLYLAGGNIWLPIITHALQNVALFQFSKERDA